MTSIAANCEPFARTSTGFVTRSRLKHTETLTVSAPTCGRIWASLAIWLRLLADNLVTVALPPCDAPSLLTPSLWLNSGPTLPVGRNAFTASVHQGPSAAGLPERSPSDPRNHASEAEAHAAADPRMAPPGEYPVILADYATGRGDRNLKRDERLCHEQSWRSSGLLPAVSGRVARGRRAWTRGWRPSSRRWCSPPRTWLGSASYNAHVAHPQRVCRAGRSKGWVAVRGLTSRTSASRRDPLAGCPCRRRLDRDRPHVGRDDPLVPGVELHVQADVVSGLGTCKLR